MDDGPVTMGGSFRSGTVGGVRSGRWAVKQVGGTGGAAHALDQPSQLRAHANQRVGGRRSEQAVAAQQVGAARPGQARDLLEAADLGESGTLVSHRHIPSSMNVLSMSAGCPA
ncbi:hypothetical protein GCM10018777_58680 [Streptomyces albogriseolus]|nr:hypothetical protein GCM10018777_58680 [Streptomyces viridodiastaticus]